MLLSCSCFWVLLIASTLCRFKSSRKISPGFRIRPAAVGSGGSGSCPLRCSGTAASFSAGSLCRLDCPIHAWYGIYLNSVLQNRKVRALYQRKIFLFYRQVHILLSRKTGKKQCIFPVLRTVKKRYSELFLSEYHLLDNRYIVALVL